MDIGNPELWGFGVGTGILLIAPLTADGERAGYRRGKGRELTRPLWRPNVERWSLVGVSTDRFAAGRSYPA
jgi:hypothetical protein